MPTNNSINGIHAQRLKAIRSFVNFDFDLRKPLSRYQKSKIKKYYDEFEKLKARPNQIYRPRIKSHLRKAQLYAQHEKGMSEFKVAFMPVTVGRKLNIKFKGDNLIVQSDHTDNNYIPLDPFQIINNDDSEARDYINGELDKYPTSDRYAVAAGAFEIPTTMGKQFVARDIIERARKYSTPEFEVGQKANHHAKNWMHGVIGYKLKKQSTIEEFRNARDEAGREREKQSAYRKGRNRAIKRIKRNIRAYNRSRNSGLLKRIKDACEKWNCKYLLETIK